MAGAGQSIVFPHTVIPDTLLVHGMRLPVLILFYLVKLPLPPAQHADWLRYTVAWPINGNLSPATLATPDNGH